MVDEYLFNKNMKIVEKNIYEIDAIRSSNLANNLRSIKSHYILYIYAFQRKLILIGYFVDDG